MYTTYGCLVGSSLPGAVAGASSAAVQHFWWGVWSEPILGHCTRLALQTGVAGDLYSSPMSTAYSCSSSSSWYVRCGSLSGGCCQGVHVHPHGGLTAAQQSWHCTKGVLWGGAVQRL